jgi:hypothetical protein
VFEHAALHGFVLQLVALLTSGRKIYVHCRGGHGRTGVVVACLLGFIYPRMAAAEVFRRIQLYHDRRVNPMGSLSMPPPSPQTTAQRTQVQRILAERKGFAASVLSFLGRAIFSCAVRGR